MTKTTTLNNNCIELAHLINQRNWNKRLFEDKIIPTYMHDKANEILSKKIAELEKVCYNCA